MKKKFEKLKSVMQVKTNAQWWSIVAISAVITYGVKSYFKLYLF